MAHASPEMTVIYAKILDETMRAQWEKTLQQGIVQFTDGKPNNERVRPAIALLKQGNVMAKTDKQEREYTDEEWEQRHHHHQEATHG